jgi:cell division septation protein DedD
LIKRLKLFVNYILTPIVVLSIIACTQTETTSKENNTNSNDYIFDEVPPEDYYTFESPPEIENADYIVQIGAFSTLDRAKHFADVSRQRLQKDIKVNYNQKKNLYAVQIHPPFNLKTEAENFRNELWKLEEYNDAWIVVKKKN